MLSVSLTPKASPFQGRDNVIRGNSFVKTDLAIHFDNRGMGNEQHSCNLTGGDYLNGVRAQQLPAWSKYGMTFDDLCVPVNNSIVGNRYCKTPTFVNNPESTVKRWKSTEADNVNSSDC